MSQKLKQLPIQSAVALLLERSSDVRKCAICKKLVNTIHRPCCSSFICDDCCTHSFTNKDVDESILGGKWLIWQLQARCPHCKKALFEDESYITPGAADAKELYVVLCGSIPFCVGILIALAFILVASRLASLKSVYGLQCYRGDGRLAFDIESLYGQSVDSASRSLCLDWRNLAEWTRYASPGFTAPSHPDAFVPCFAKVLGNSSTMIVGEAGISAGWGSIESTPYSLAMFEGLPAVTRNGSTLSTTSAACAPQSSCTVPYTTCVTDACLYDVTLGRLGWDIVDSPILMGPGVDDSSERLIIADALNAPIGYASAPPDPLNSEALGIVNGTLSKLWALSVGGRFSASCGSNSYTEWALRFGGNNPRLLISAPFDAKYGIAVQFDLIFGSGTPNCPNTAQGSLFVDYAVDSVSCSASWDWFLPLWQRAIDALSIGASGGAPSTSIHLLGGGSEHDSVIISAETLRTFATPPSSSSSSSSPSARSFSVSDWFDELASSSLLPVINPQLQGDPVVRSHVLTILLYNLLCAPSAPLAGSLDAVSAVSLMNAASVSRGILMASDAQGNVVYQAIPPFAPAVWNELSAHSVEGPGASTVSDWLTCLSLGGAAVPSQPCNVSIVALADWAPANMSIETLLQSSQLTWIPGNSVPFDRTVYVKTPGRLVPTTVSLASDGRRKCMRIRWNQPNYWPAWDAWSMSNVVVKDMLPVPTAAAKKRAAQDLSLYSCCAGCSLCSADQALQCSRENMTGIRHTAGFPLQDVQTNASLSGSSSSSSSSSFPFKRQRQLSINATPILLIIAFSFALFKLISNLASSIRIALHVLIPREVILQRIIAATSWMARSLIPGYVTRRHSASALTVRDDDDDDDDIAEQRKKAKAGKLVGEGGTAAATVKQNEALSKVFSSSNLLDKDGIAGGGGGGRGGRKSSSPSLLDNDGTTGVRGGRKSSSPSLKVRQTPLPQGLLTNSARVEAPLQEHFDTAAAAVTVPASASTDDPTLPSSLPLNIFDFMGPDRIRPQENRLLVGALNAKLHVSSAAALNSLETARLIKATAAVEALQSGPGRSSRNAVQDLGATVTPASRESHTTSKSNASSTLIKPRKRGHSSSRRRTKEVKENENGENGDHTAILVVEDAEEEGPVGEPIGNSASDGHEVSIAHNHAYASSVDGEGSAGDASNVQHDLSAHPAQEDAAGIASTSQLQEVKRKTVPPPATNSTQSGDAAKRDANLKPSSLSRTTHLLGIPFYPLDSLTPPILFGVLMIVFWAPTAWSLSALPSAVSKVFSAQVSPLITAPTTADAGPFIQWKYLAGQLYSFPAVYIGVLAVLTDVYHLLAAIVAAGFYCPCIAHRVAFFLKKSASLAKAKLGNIVIQDHNTGVHDQDHNTGVDEESKNSSSLVTSSAGSTADGVVVPSSSSVAEVGAQVSSKNSGEVSSGNNARSSFSKTVPDTPSSIAENAVDPASQTADPGALLMPSTVSLPFGSDHAVSSDRGGDRNDGRASGASKHPATSISSAASPSDESDRAASSGGGGVPPSYESTFGASPSSSGAPPSDESTQQALSSEASSSASSHSSSLLSSQQVPSVISDSNAVSSVPSTLPAKKRSPFHASSPPSFLGIGSVDDFRGGPFSDIFGAASLTLDLPQQLLNDPLQFSLRHVRAVTVESMVGGSVIPLFSLILHGLPLSCLCWASEASVAYPMTVIVACVSVLRSIGGPFSVLTAALLVKASVSSLFGCCGRYIYWRVAGIIRFFWRLFCNENLSGKVAPGKKQQQRPHEASSLPISTTPPPTPRHAVRGSRRGGDLSYLPVAACCAFRAKRVALLWFMWGLLVMLIAYIVYIVFLFFQKVSSPEFAAFLQYPPLPIAIAAIPIASAVYGYLVGAFASMPSKILLASVGFGPALKIFLPLPIASESIAFCGVSCLWPCGEGRSGIGSPVVGSCAGSCTPLVDGITVRGGCVPTYARHFRLSPRPQEEACIWISLPADIQQVEEIAALIRNACLPSRWRDASNDEDAD